MNTQELGLKEIVGQLVTLFQVNAENISPEYLTWLNHRQVRKYLEVRFEDHTSRSIREFVERCNGSSTTLLLGIRRLDTGQYIGNIKLSWDANHMVGDIGIMIGDTNSWGRGLASDAINLMTAVAFNQIGLRKVVAGAYQDNAASLRAFQRCGYSEEARLTEHVLLDGHPTDVILMCMHKKDFLKLAPPKQADAVPAPDRQ